MGRHIDPCSAARELLEAREQRPLQARQLRALEKHLAACDGCRRWAELNGLIARGDLLLEESDTVSKPRSNARLQASSERFLATTMPPPRSHAVAVGMIPPGRRASPRRRRAPEHQGLRGPAAFALMGLAAVAFSGLAVAMLHGRSPAAPIAPPAPAAQSRAATAAPKQPEPPATAPVARVESATGNAWLVRSGDLLALTEDLAIQDHDRVETGADGAASISYDDGSRIELAGGSILTVWEAGGAKRLILERGAIYARVAAQPEGLAMVLNPGRSDQVTVVGTTFELARTDDRSLVRMESGRVLFGSGRTATYLLAGEESAQCGSAAPLPPAKIAATQVAAWRWPSLEMGTAHPPECAKKSTAESAVPVPTGTDAVIPSIPEGPKTPSSRTITDCAAPSATVQPEPVEDAEPVAPSEPDALEQPEEARKPSNPEPPKSPKPEHPTKPEQPKPDQPKQEPPKPPKSEPTKPPKPPDPKPPKSPDPKPPKSPSPPKQEKPNPPEPKPPKAPKAPKKNG